MLFVAIAAPVVVAGIAVLADRWRPLGDLAVMTFQVTQVGTRDTPLVGPYSTSFSHPGPLLFWAGAIPFRLLGDDPRGLLWLAVAVNATSVVVIGWIAGRIGGRTLQVVTALAVALLLHDLGATVLISPWNPHVSVLPFLVLLFCLWAAALGSRRALFAAAVAAAWVVQAHVGYLALVVVLGAWLVGWLAARIRRDRARGRDTTLLARALFGATVVFLVLMTPLVVDQVAGRQNLSALWRTFVVEDQARVGVGVAAGIVSRFLQPVGPWTGAEVPRTFVGAVAGAGLWSLVLVVAILLALVVIAARRGRRDVMVPATLAVTLAVVATPVASRIRPPGFEYMLEWLHPLGAFVWLVIVWGVVRLVPWPDRVRGAAPAARLVTALAAVLVAASLLPSALDPELPDGSVAPTVATVLDRLADVERAGAGTVRVDSTGDTSGQATSGIVYDLIRRGVRVRTDIGREWHQWDDEHTLAPGETTDRTLTVVVTTTPDRAGAPHPCSGDPAQRRVAAASGPTTGRGLFARTYRVEVFEGPAPCAPTSP